MGTLSHPEAARPTSPVPVPSSWQVGEGTDSGSGVWGSGHCGVAGRPPTGGGASQSPRLCSSAQRSFPSASEAGVKPGHEGVKAPSPAPGAGRAEEGRVSLSSRPDIRGQNPTSFLPATESCRRTTRGNCPQGVRKCFENAARASPLNAASSGLPSEVHKVHSATPGLQCPLLW